MIWNKGHLPIAIVVVMLGGLTGASPAAADPPDRAARISFLSGAVSFRPGTLDEWADAIRNYPLTTGDTLWTDRAGRAEVQMGDAVARLGPDTSFTVLNLDDQLTQVRITQGSLALSVRDISNDEQFEIDTPNGAVTAIRPGFYRVDVNDTGDATTVTVRRGDADVTSGDGRSFAVRAAESIVLTGPDSPRAHQEAAIGLDEWEDWCQRRDRSALEAVSARYVSPDTIGYADLDAFGSWRNVDPYGPVWVPSVRGDWAPYRDGRWIWVEPWGWTWVDDEPWGYAPFHYGRWVNMHGVWGWCPGRRVERAIYAPALVAFVGGPRLQVALSINEPVAWFPLGPGDPYIPAYDASPSYIRAVNVTSVNATNINGVHATYVNRTVPGAVTAVSANTFVKVQPVRAVARVVPPTAVRQASVIGAAPRVAPTPLSVIGQGRRTGRVPPATTLQRRVVARTSPPPPPVPFSAREPALKERPGRPVDPQTLSRLRPERGTMGTTPNPAKTAAPPPGNSQPRRANEPSRAVTPRPAPARASEPPERRTETRTTPVPRRVPQPRPPGPPAPAATVRPPNPDSGQLAARQAAARAQLEQQHAAEQAQLNAQRAQRERQAAGAQKQQQARQAADQQKRALDQQQMREHEQLRQQQQVERAKQPQKAQPAPPARPPQKAQPPRARPQPKAQQPPPAKPQPKVQQPPPAKPPAKAQQPPPAKKKKGGGE